MSPVNITLYNLCAEGNVEAVIDWVKSGKDPDGHDKRGRTGLHLAAARGREDILRVLVDYGADVTAYDRQGNTPLHYCGHKETITCLLESGADANARNNHGDTPLMLMKRRGIEPDVQKMMEDIQDDEIMNADESSSQPLIKRKYLIKLQDKSLRHMQSVWYEFCEELGMQRLIAVILVVLCLSLYVAYMVTGFSNRMNTKIPIVDEDMKRLEL